MNDRAELLAPYLDAIHTRFCQFGERTALSDRAGSLSYRELITRAECFSRQLTSVGIKAGDRIALLARPGTTWAVAFFGILLTGATVIPLDILMPEQDLGFVLEHADPALVICAAEFERRVTAAAPAFPRFVLGQDEARETEKPVDAGMRTLDDVMAIIYTSGTTGTPKGIMATYRNLLSQVAPARQFMGVHPDDAALSLLPLNYMMELALGFLCPLFAGLRAHFCDSIYPHDIIAACQQNNITHMIVVPRLLTLLQRAIPEGEVAPFGQQFKAVLCGGAPLTPAYIEHFRSRGVTVCQGYGMTETSPVITSNTPAHNKPGSVGLPYPGTEVRIADDGEVLVRGPSVMKGYFRDEDATKAVLQGGWLHTGDLGRIDDEGYLSLLGRKKDLIILASGKNIYPEQLSEHFLTLPAIKESSIIHVEGSGHAKDEGLCLVVHLSEKYIGDTGTLAADIARLSAALDSYKRPRWLAISDEPLPRTNSLKIRRFMVGKWLESREMMPLP